MRQQLLQLARLGVSLPSQLRHPVTTAEARRLLHEQQVQRSENFLASARQLVYDNRASPYGKLLRWAGCEYSDLQQSVRADGVNGTLERLRDAGVYLSLDEFKRQTPIVRLGLTLAPVEADFDNPLLVGTRANQAIEGTTSGSRTRPSRVMYTWPFISEESAHEQLLYVEHRVEQLPVALWYPAPPGVAGVHNLLMDLKRGRAPSRWFSQVNPASSSMSRATRLALPAIRWGGRLAGMVVPAPEFADFDHTDRVLNWMRGRCVLRTFASSAVRLAERARECGRDLSGVVIFTGGEPLTDARRATIESTGATVFARYVVTESGLVGASCTHRTSTDDIHVYTGRVALVNGHEDLLLSTLSLHTAKVLFNTSVGDTGTLTTLPCSCEFGQLGLNTRLSNIRSQQRLTVEGMTVLAADFDAALTEVIATTHIRAHAVQYRCEVDQRGIERLIIAISSAEATDVNERAFVEAVFDAMRRRGAALQLAAELWRQSDSLTIVREQPDGSSNGKRPLRARTSHVH